MAAPEIKKVFISSVDTDNEENRALLIDSFACEAMKVMLEKSIDSDLTINESKLKLISYNSFKMAETMFNMRAEMFFKEKPNNE